jgi:hypothetical protein
MRRIKRTDAVVVLLVCASLAVLALPGCGSSASGDATGGEPARVEKVAGSTVSRITLTADAARRIGIETTASRGTQIPYAAVLYDDNGGTWAYTSPSSLVFVREPISVERIDGDVAFLTRGPASGVSVVTVGAAELWGIELGVGE